MGRPIKWREQFISDMAREGQSIDTARAILRIGATLQRVAEAQCNGDWPFDNGDRKVAECPHCKGLCAPSAITSRKGCPDCRSMARAKALVPKGWTAEFQGDPRGCIMTLVAPSGRKVGVP